MIETLRFIWTHPLARQSRLKVISRFVRWQLGSRILGWPAIVPFVDGSTLVVERGMYGATGNVYCGLYEFVDMAFLLHFLRPEDRFVDVGANVGTYTVLASAVVGAETISVEPVAETFALLKRNIRVNDVGHLVTAVCCAAGRMDEMRRMSADRGPRSRFVSQGFEGRSVDVPTRPLDALLGNQPTALWKLDVEGSELEVLEGATRSIQEPTLQAMIVESDNEAISSFLRKYGFEPATYHPFTRELNGLDGRPVSKNHLWLRDREAVTQRWKQGRSYQILSTTV